MDERDLHYPLERILTYPGVLPREVDLTKYVDYVRDQGTTGSCVGFAVTRACHIRAQVQGISAKHGSPLYAYSLGRANVYDNQRPLRDTGSQPRNVLKAIQTHGLAAEDKWAWDSNKNDIDLSRVNETPDWKALEAADDALLNYGAVGYYWLQGSGEERVTQTKASIAAGMPVCFAVDVEPEFVIWNDDKPIPDLDEDAPILGGHYLCAIGYTSDDDIIFVNSWSSAWADMGFGILSKARFMNPSTRTLCAIEVAPRVL